MLVFLFLAFPPFIEDTPTTNFQFNYEKVFLFCGVNKLKHFGIFHATEASTFHLRARLVVVASMFHR
jgi:hypothetical protein